MGPLFLVLVWLAVAAHFVFLAYLPAGGFLALRWRRTIWLHMLAVLWGTASVVVRFDCPLTSIEQWARRHAGLAPLPESGFIAHYVTGVFYPEGDTGYARAVVLIAVTVSWAAFAFTRSRGKLVGTPTGHAK